MGTIIDYVKNAVMPFSIDFPFNEADAIVFSQLSYFHFPSEVPRLQFDATAVRHCILQQPLHSHMDASRYFARRFKTVTQSTCTQRFIENPLIATPEQRHHRFSLGKSSQETPDQKTNDITPANTVTSFSSPYPLKHLLRSEYYSSLVYDVAYSHQNIELLEALGSSPRFRNVMIQHFVEPDSPTSPVRFSAVTFDLGNGVLYIAFRGTDSTVAGWHDNYRMTFLSPVPSQAIAADYFARIATEWNGMFILGGHSKGGNLAVYASAVAPYVVQHRILAVYSLDGPGFSDRFIHSQGYLTIKNRIHKIIPEGSLIGTLLLSNSDSHIVKSTASGIMQHYPMTWVFNDQNQLVASDHVTALSAYITKTVNQWMWKFEPAKRRCFIDGFFDSITKAGYTDFIDIFADLKTSIPKIYAQIRQLPSDERKLISMFLTGLVNVAVNTLPELWHR